MVSKSDKKKYLPNSKGCFVCGEENAAGLRTRFYVEDGIVKARWHPQEHHCGFENVVHGGVTAALLDECMVWAATRAFGRFCVTGELSVRYLKRIPCDRELTVRAEVAKYGSRVMDVRGTITDDDGQEYAQGHARFVPISIEETLEVEEMLLYRGGEERVFDQLRPKTK